MPVQSAASDPRRPSRTTRPRLPQATRPLNQNGVRPNRAVGEPPVLAVPRVREPRGTYLRASCLVVVSCHPQDALPEQLPQPDELLQALLEVPANCRQAEHSGAAPMEGDLDAMHPRLFPGIPPGTQPG